MKHNLAWLAAFALIGIVSVWSVVSARPYTLRGSELSPAGPAPEIELPRADGGSYQLSARAGRPVIIFFGYTSCPDVCPATMAVFKQARADLGSSAEGVDFLFITVDPQRDTAEKMAAYLKGFDDGVIGLTGNESELSTVWQAYGVYRQIVPGSTPETYSVDHTSRIYLIDKQGNLRATYAFGTTAEDIVSDLRYLLREK
ncbi:uncharacterized protein SCO1/SenC/PrrC [Longilinea arvoryzae]|uniref:Uncharacterized protein SCO1/SenC/PrrC n=1 Tax=Longilinea arvoryzae TaxID=360412 RepID=A0A0S7BBJ7_9CHLR|nr:SCO family protein [Longilinea arvoryzae]GAP15183.1 uncharacterized protein SCO1/SenC/PrrC [Longilinea arvoryzae]